jgi:hypothetical protein
MTASTRPSEYSPPSLAQNLLGLARSYLGGRRGFLVLSVLALGAGLSLNWGWLTAIGAAPILVSLLPCAAMCAFGLCKSRAGGKSCSTGASPHDEAPDKYATVSDSQPDMVTHQIPVSTVAVPVADAELKPVKRRNKFNA